MKQSPGRATERAAAVATTWVAGGSRKQAAPVRPQGPPGSWARALCTSLSTSEEAGASDITQLSSVPENSSRHSGHVRLHTFLRKARQALLGHAGCLHAPSLPHSEGRQVRQPWMA